VARPQFTGVRTIGRKAHLIFQGSTCAVTLSTHKGRQDPWGSVMGQSLCQSLSPSLINPYNLNSHWMLWEGQVFCGLSGKVTCVLCTFITGERHIGCMPLDTSETWALFFSNFQNMSKWTNTPINKVKWLLNALVCTYVVWSCSCPTLPFHEKLLVLTIQCRSLSELEQLINYEGWNLIKGYNV